jgi:hypothetical protein
VRIIRFVQAGFCFWVYFVSCCNCYIGCGSIRGSKIDLGEVEAEVAQKFMKEAIYQARLAHSSGQVTFISHDLH